MLYIRLSRSNKSWLKDNLMEDVYTKISFFLTTIIFYSNACYNQLHKLKHLMKQYI